ncbi:MAG: hypothetical protein P9X24_14815 [Candidatus Hatepunaea meridiana]|nr:hypothetical protein [Candidatus Hatepunaea meridiana]
MAELKPFKEGNFRKGGVNNPPKTPRPSTPPAASRPVALRPDTPSSQRNHKQTSKMIHLSVDINIRNT